MQNIYNIKNELNFSKLTKLNKSLINIYLIN